jgi:hypothetical protein
MTVRLIKNGYFMTAKLLARWHEMEYQPKISPHTARRFVPDCCFFVRPESLNCRPLTPEQTVPQQGFYAT